MASSSFIDYKNKVRGAVSILKSSSFSKSTNVNRQLNFRNELKKILGSARDTLPIDDYKSFISWFFRQMEQEKPNFNYSKFDLESLRFIYQSNNLPDIDRVLIQTSVLLKNQARFLNRFTISKEEIEQLIFSGNYKIALEKLIKLEEIFGNSVWNIELRIALEQLNSGLESQKNYVNNVRKFLKHSVLDYIVYSTSIRNEERTTLGNYIDSVSKALNRSAVNHNLKEYIKFTLLPSSLKDRKSIARILGIEQSFSTIDLYNTYIVVLQELAKQRYFEEKTSIAAELLENLVDISDYRINKFAKYVLDAPFVFSDRPTFISDEMFSGNYLTTIKKYRRLPKELSIDPWHIIYASFSVKRHSSTDTRLIELPHQIYLNIGLLLSGNGNAVLNLMALNKQLINFGGLTTSLALSEFINILFSDDPKNNWNTENIGLYSPFEGVEDNKQATVETITVRVWKSQKNPPMIGSILDTIVSIFNAIRFIKEGKHRKALNSISYLPVKYCPQPISNIIDIIKLQCLYELKEKSNLVALIASSDCNSNGLSALLPITSAFAQYKFHDFYVAKNHLASPIALYHLWVRTDSSEVLSHVKIMTKIKLKEIGVKKPSELSANDFLGQSELLIFFLRHVCIPQIIDILREITGTKSVLLERQEICQMLIEIDSSNKNLYLDEVLEIERQIQLSEGQRMVDGTRIYVDFDALKKWATKEVHEDFNRWRDMIDTGAGQSEGFDDSQVDYTGLNENIIVNIKATKESDSLLLAIVNKISYEFLTNSSFGLDYYLSKRIRHQSFIGLIRSHFEFSKLITVRENRSSEYEFNHYWIEKFKSLDSNSKHQLNKLLTGFAINFDELLLDARDNKFHIKTEEHPEGLIYIEYNSLIIGMLKQFLTQADSIEDFLESLQFLLRAILVHSLERTKEFIEKSLKYEISNFVDQLKANVKTLAENDPAFIEFDVELSQKSTEVQRSLDDVITWFSPIELSDLQRSFSIRQIIEIAVEGVLRLHKAFKPTVKINHTEETEFQLHSLSLTLINDIFFILFDNVKTHSGIKEPTICINVHATQDCIEITFNSESKASLRLNHETELKKIRALIDNKNFSSRRKSEGKSGIIKMAADVSEIPKASLKFGFVDSGNFEANIRYPITFSKMVVQSEK